MRWWVVGGNHILDAKANTKVYFPLQVPDKVPSLVSSDFANCYFLKIPYVRFISLCSNMHFWQLETDPSPNPLNLLLPQIQDPLVLHSTL